MWFVQSHNMVAKTITQTLVSRPPDCAVSITWSPTATLKHTNWFLMSNSAKHMSPEMGIKSAFLILAYIDPH